MTVDVGIDGQVALVTGAATGLGFGFSKTLARSGAIVGLAGRRPDRLADAVARVETEGGTAFPVTLDVRDPDAIEAAMEHITQIYRPPQILVNNAGVPDARRAHQMPLELVDTVLETNIRGPWLLATAVASRLIAAGLEGRIVNVSSMSALDYRGEGAALYSVTKAAMSRMAEVLAVEWAAYGINVNAIAPGAFASEMMDAMLDRVGDITTSFPRKRLGDPAMLESTLLYLVSPASQYVTGTVIKVDDGQYPR
ncbi:SDR family NAD(P)-dependent oxidoreductase [Rhodococcus qingshengii]|uniref:SDR family NAD(P)-dependent oxidoreductase n=1 Tax=Rhodococcus qingshengii TaxID=334542 RepID=UPI00210D43C0|nr:SDR family oxidoreductase [Rhodococcus qingshengii]MCQ4152152.1 SDR family oxidoreductase [Rhodococcus qingshengii]